MNQHYVFGVIVTYHPSASALSSLVESLAGQVEALVIVDNASPDFPGGELEAKYDNLRIIRNCENVGLASAYNQGIAEAKAHHASHLILFDQDSLPAPNMVERLVRELLQRNEDTFRVAAAGPKYVDIKGQQLSPFVRIKGFHLERVTCADNEVVDVDHLISSGTLIDMRALDSVGNFVDELFIDAVDTEWCLRARSHGLRIIGVGSAAMQHNIGDAYLVLMGKQLPLHSPMRLYYQFRNQIWLIKQPWVGWRWRVIDSIRCIKLFIVFAIFAPNKLTNLSFMIKGGVDGFFSRMGRMRT